jgi:4-nitrophenyl phosphatase
MDFSTIRAVVMDMDGVLWRGDTPLPGMIALFERLRARNLPFMLASNNSTTAPTDYAAKLARLGVANIAPREIITSSTATASYLQTHYPAGTRVYIIGMDGLRRVLTEAGFTIADEDVRAVIVGGDFEVTYAKLKRATLLIRAGADFIGTNPDPTFPLPEGLAPGAGSLIAAVRTATDCEPVIIGKPGRPMFEAALQQLGTAAAETLMIGDRLDTDILGAQRAGLRTALVLTGVTHRDQLPASPIQPDAVFDDLPALLDAWG